ncbi:unnamed protein product [Auanema sp. JU1783]|nr:unnamed protein product [Auanema sp. JU1783]
MSALEAFITEQKKKAGGLTGGLGSASFSSLGDLRSKLSSSISGIPLLSRSETEDSQTLTGEISNGQLPQGKNRKNTGGWFSSSDESIFGLSRTQRIFAFFMCVIGALFCFSTAAFLIPVIIFKTRKFAALNTLGCTLLFLSFAFLLGPYAYFQHLLSAQRRLVTVCYLSSLFATLYSSLWLQSTVFTLIAAIFEGFSLVWFVLSYVPGGEYGLRFITGFFTRFITRSPSTVLPI